MPPLDRAAPGSSVVLEQIDDSMHAHLREQLAAYGLLPGRRVTVLQQQPLTVIVCDHVEIALEKNVARSVEVAASG
jgi:Fe2+ transport system protein FeoA